MAVLLYVKIRRWTFGKGSRAESGYKQTHGLRLLIFLAIYVNNAYNQDNSIYAADRGPTFTPVNLSWWYDILAEVMHIAASVFM